MYDTMVYWETADKEPDQPKVALEYARVWQAAEKIVFSRTLSQPRSSRTRIEGNFDPAMLRELKMNAGHDLSIDGPELAAQAIRAGLVDEFHLITCPVIVGGGKKFFPEDVQLDLELINEKHFNSSGVVVVQYAVQRKS
jgi:dihydrofolate reductase